MKSEAIDYHYWLCADVCDCMERVDELKAFCRNGFACPNTGHHEKLQELLAKHP